MKSLTITVFAALLLMFTACQGADEANEPADAAGDTTDVVDLKDSSKMLDNEEIIVMEKNGLSLMSLTTSKEFPNATLKTLAPVNNAAIEKEGTVNFKYKITGYDLGAQTPGAKENGLANSAKGQHIHAILNNEPYMAHYEPGFSKDLKAGRYVLLSFLSRSYHESVKHENAYELLQFTVGETDAPAADLSAPHLFYSRPKGTYKGADAQSILLDFYLVNCTLSEDGYKVKATINGTEFMLTKWMPYVIEGLPMGDIEITLELIDGAGNTVDSPFNPVTRTIELQAG